ncbi:acyl-CoA dehydrogenase family protein [Paenibacillus sp. MBLB4367]|uniref:acyl-CoA dehydrogenase family protein n=1 Tax=Paenibacillus sp. MBLB4367 TaxID=3384767 RepID=UPI00390826BB
MRFRLPEELEMTRTVIREFAEKEVAPGAGERDEAEQFDRKLFDQIAALGLAGIPWPERYGGAGSDMLTFAVVTEELARVCASTAAVLGGHTAHAGWPLCRYGDEKQKGDVLNALAGGTKLGASVFPYRSGRRGVRTHGINVRPESGGSLVLEGTHPYVNGAEEADLFLVYAFEREPYGKKWDRLSVFVVDKGDAGYDAGKSQKRKLGLRSMSMNELRFTACRLSESSRIGKAGQGMEILRSTLAAGQLSAAAQAVGIAQGALEAAVGYAKERKQFGERIGRRQGISFKLTDMAVKLDAARLLTYQAAWRLDAGLSFAREAAMAKRYSLNAAAAIGIEVVQVFGGYGYMREYRVERFLRDAKWLQANGVTGGTDEEEIKRMLTDG